MWAIYSVASDGSKSRVSDFVETFYNEALADAWDYLDAHPNQDMCLMVKHDGNSNPINGEEYAMHKVTA